MKNTNYSDDRVLLAQNLRKMQRDSSLAAKNLVALRASAYKSAIVINRILHNSMNELLEDLRTLYAGEKNPVDKWLMEQFKPYVMLGGDYCEALRAVEKKVPLKRFLALDFTITMRAKPSKGPKPAKAAAAPVEVPPVPVDEAPVVEKAVAWEKRAVFLDTRVGTLADQLRDAKRRIRELEEENAILKTRLRKFEALV